MYIRKLYFGNIKTGNIYFSGLALYGFPSPRKFIKVFTILLYSRIHRGHLHDITGEFFFKKIDLLLGNMAEGFFTQNFCFKVHRRSSFTKSNGAGISFFKILEIRYGFCLFTGTQYQKSSGKRIQSSRMSNLQPSDSISYFVNHFKRRPSKGFVNKNLLPTMEIQTCKINSLLAYHYLYVSFLSGFQSSQHNLLYRQ